ncbi:MAG: hypothetical protein WBX25_25875 [Rhodomicrobium sp.]
MTHCRLSERRVLEVVIRQGGLIPCGICHEPLRLEDAITAIRDHALCRHVFPEERIWEWGRIENQRYVHGRCSRLKTYGRPHTSLGSDAHIKAKTRRLRGETGKGPKPKISSGGFRKDLKRTLDGRVIDRKTGKELWVRAKRIPQGRQ